MRSGLWIWLALWILSLIGISNYGGAVSYGLFFMLTLLSLLSVLYLFCVFLQFKIYQEVESRDMICGQSVPYYFVLRNESFFGFAGVKVRMFPDFSYIENVRDDVEYELLPGDVFRYDTRLTCKYRGEYEVGAKEVVVTDFLHLFRFRCRIPGTIRAIVHPKIVELTELKEISHFFAVQQQESYAEKKEPDVVVRDYIRGDALNRIHWKNTARQQKLKVRNDIDEAKQEIAVFLDTRRYSKDMREYLPLESKMLETAIALGIYFAKNNVHTSLYYGEKGLRQSSLADMRGFEEFYNRISEIRFESNADTAALFEECCSKGLLWKAKIVIGIFHKPEDKILHLADQLAAAGTSVVFYAVTDENMEPYVKQNTSRRKIIVIPTEEELEGLL